MTDSIKKIALFGGSFNPPHVAHAEVVKYLADNNQFDEVWMMPTFSHPFSKDLVSFEHRAKMCEIICNNSDKTKVCLIEGELKKTPSYSVDILKELLKKYPKNKFFFVVGSDVKSQLNQWKSVEELKKMTEFYFLPRAGFEKSSFTNVSSSHIRKRFNEKLKSDSLVLPQILEYIKKNKLYGF